MFRDSGTSVTIVIALAIAALVLVASWITILPVRRRSAAAQRARPSSIHLVGQWRPSLRRALLPRPSWSPWRTYLEIELAPDHVELRSGTPSYSRRLPGRPTDVVWFRRGDVVGDRGRAARFGGAICISIDGADVEIPLVQATGLGFGYLRERDLEALRTRLRTMTQRTR